MHRKARAMKARAIFFSLFAPCTLWVSDGSIILYDASAGQDPQDPQETGWQARGNFLDQNTQASQYPPKGQHQEIEGRSFRAWRIANPPPAPNDYSAYYVQNLNTFDFLGPAGWTLSARLKVISSNDGFSAQTLKIRDGISSWEIAFIKDANQQIETIAFKDQSNQNQVLIDYPQTNEFITFEAFYNPSEENLSFFIDGKPLEKKVNRSDVPQVQNNQKQIIWGDLDVSARPVRTEAHWNKIRLINGLNHLENLPLE